MRHIAISKDGGENWNNLSVSEFLPDGQKNSDYGLMAGLDIFDYCDEEIIVYTNIDSYDKRSNGMIWASTDQGNTWPIKKKIDEFGFKYSSIAIGRKNTKTEGMIYILYETGKEKNINEYGGGKIARFNYAWLLNNND